MEEGEGYKRYDLDFEKPVEARHAASQVCESNEIRSPYAIGVQSGSRYGFIVHDGGLDVGIEGEYRPLFTIWWEPVDGNPKLGKVFDVTECRDTIDDHVGTDEC